MFAYLSVYVNGFILYNVSSKIEIKISGLFLEKKRMTNSWYSLILDPTSSVYLQLSISIFKALTSKKQLKNNFSFIFFSAVKREKGLRYIWKYTKVTLV